MRGTRAIVLLATALLLVGGCDKPKRQFVRLPAPSSSAAPTEPPVVPGAFCSPAGQRGTARGVEYVCAGPTPRWRRP
jgi:hypothetical protein